MTDADLEAAWVEVRENTPEGWYVGTPMEHPERQEWAMFALDPSETPGAGKRSREWTTVARTEVEVVRQMARGLGDVKAGGWPR